MDKKQLKKIIKHSQKSNAFDIVNQGSGYQIQDVDDWCDEIRTVTKDLVSKILTLEEENNRLMREREIHAEEETSSEMHEKSRLQRLHLIPTKSHHLVKRVARLESEVAELRNKIKEIDRKSRK